MSTGLIIAPNGFPAVKQRQTLSKEEVKLITDFEAWCHRRKIALDLICTECLDAGNGKASRLAGNNLRNSTRYTVTCAHAERVHGV